LKYNHMSDWTQDEYNQLLGLKYSFESDNQPTDSFNFIDHFKNIFHKNNNES
jgi:hypothetical protein